MPAIGLTGGIATGKTTFAREFVSRISADFFDADACVHTLLDSDHRVQALIQDSLGVRLEDGKLDRAELRALVFSDPAKRKQLESILHPEIRQQWLARAKEGAATDRWFCADLPLLFETGAEAYFDRVIVVACAPATQLERLETNRGISPSLAANMIAAQLDLREKVAKAAYLIWNDSTEANLIGQTDLLISSLRQRYG